MADKFKDILLCTDLDDTLLTSGDKKLSSENRQAIKYFMSEGGYFTFATGRVPAGINLILDMITPNVPMICFNGGAVYDFKNNNMLWNTHLDKEAIKVLEFVEKYFPDIGIEVCTDNNIYFCKDNRLAQMHRNHENLPHNTLDYHNIYAPWKKVIFLSEEDKMPELIRGIALSQFAASYHFVRSSPHYFELLPKGVSKGAALLKLADILNINPSRTIGIGDNHNDIELIKNAGIGIAVANAVPEARQAADIITVDNNSSAVAAVISSLDIGLITF